MADYRKKRMKKFRRRHSWVGVILFCVFFVITVIVMAALAEVFLGMFIKNKSEGEIANARYMSAIYESVPKDSDKNAIYDVLDRSERPYAIMDKNGNVIYSHGRNTIGNKGDIIKDNIFFDNESEADGISENVMYYYDDSECKYLDIVDGRPDLNVLLFLEDFTGKSIENAQSETDIVISLPYWIAVDVDDAEHELVIKSFIDIELSDVFFIVLALILLGILAVLLFIIMITSAIINSVNNKRAFKLLFTDIVTNGYNRLWFVYKGNSFLAKKSTSKNTYAVVNLNFVKYRNYCICHSIEKGEAVLTKVYGVIAGHIDKKEMVAHVSDSNYALLLQYNDMSELESRLKSMLSALERVCPEQVFSFQMGIDMVGIFRNEKGRIVRRKNIDIELEYNNACAARATLADSDGSGIAFFDSKLVEDQKWIDAVTERQRYAIEHEEFMVYYQPKYDPNTNTLKGAEALIRWQNDDMGFVPPGRFIPIFEKNGFITEIDHYMLEHVARDQKAWLDAGKEPVPVSVNVSRAHFIESNLAEQIRDIVDRAGTPHKYIEIELTESAFFDDKKALIATINKLREYGFAVSMDDFGSGYSSLNSLKDMPLDVLKLDAEFFRGESEGDRGEIVIAEAIRLAKSLNMRIVAEGVEIKEQVDFLSSQGCDMIQGYYYAKPMAKSEYEQFLCN